jgi:hypothetical protein
MKFICCGIPSVSSYELEGLLLIILLLLLLLALLLLVLGLLLLLVLGLLLLRHDPVISIGIIDTIVDLVLQEATCTTGLYKLLLVRVWEANLRCLCTIVAWLPGAMVILLFRWAVLCYLIAFCTGFLLI